jgi:hypothetical protein
LIKVKVIECVKIIIGLIESFFFVVVEHDHNVGGLDQGCDKCGHLENQVPKEDVVVSDTDTVVDPRTVMIISVHTRVTDDTVTRSAGSDGFTFWA